MTDVEKLRIHSKGRSLRVADVISFFSDITEVSSCIAYIVQFLGSRWHFLITLFFPQSSLVYVQDRTCCTQSKFS